MKIQYVPGECLRWYLKQARHPYKNYIVGHYWQWFCKPHVWIRYDDALGINVSLQDYVPRAIFFEGYYERPLIEWLKANLRSDDVFWDIGANIGAVSLVAAWRCFHVAAFEPDPRSLARLEANIRFNHLTNIEMIPTALGANAGTITLHQGADLNTGMSSIMDGRVQTDKRVNVAVQRADDFLVTRPDLFPGLVKMDVEGAEHLVVQGARKMLRDSRLRALVFEDRRDSENGPTNRALVAELLSAGLHIRPLAASDEHAQDDMINFLAERT
jgi:FkbM family methyltransferase